ncbi:MAG: Fe-S protein assembly co-chaperone HscB [Burkholderiales bacterium]|jgi:molecular chaperone HscB|nr:Fe-S protein assembly co-chaperone HscB [Burkholderiales bacterium]
MISLSDSYYQLFNLPVAFEVATDVLQATFLRLQAQVHPDRYTSGSDTEKRLAMQWATHVNQAYRTLKEPVTRAAYWCELQGQAVNAEYNTAMSPKFLMQQMEWRESLGDAESLAALESLQKEVSACRKQTLGKLAQVIDVEHNPVGAAELTRQMMFVEKFQKELNYAFERLEG